MSVAVRAVLSSMPKVWRAELSKASRVAALWERSSSLPDLAHWRTKVEPRYLAHSSLTMPRGMADGCWVMDDGRCRYIRWSLMNSDWRRSFSDWTVLTVAFRSVTFFSDLVMPSLISVRPLRNSSMISVCILLVGGWGVDG